MSFLFPSPKPPSLPPPAPPPPLPTQDDAGVEARRRELAESRARKMRGGIQGSIKTSGLGDTSEPLIERKSALG